MHGLNKLRDRREAAAFSRQHLAELSGLSMSLIAMAERGLIVSDASAAELAAALEVDVDVIGEVAS
jgi:transcriptional regulator with XRE-family HTH domain